ncbi:hypothetical protein BIV24_03000 [Streptomyces colonosanans]|uniref:DUF1396 domain-containing protein n=2 Tax=Streptomyces colonosanans TaxID=1428652 RepID=A0A1S2Q1L8_9ACTN|nr:hypothetical protein BIV24_03000 [Streptomyces colonosanans]
MRAGRRNAVGALVVVALLGGAVGCSGSDGAAKETRKNTKAESAQSGQSAANVITAAYKKTAAAKSARVEMSMSMPESADGGGAIKVTGMQGWDPTVMDFTMDGSMLAKAGSDGPSKVRMIWRDNIMYMDMGAEAAKELPDGKRWMKMDLGAMAEQSGDAQAMKAMTSGLDDMNQNPAQQLALLLESPNLKHLGAATVDGVKTEHYKGHLTVDEMMKSNSALDVLEPKDRKQLLDNIEKTGIKGYDTEVWVNQDNFPARMDVTMKTPKGDMKVMSKYSDYGAAIQVKTPPAGETVDFMDLMKELGQNAGGAGASS